MSASQLLASGSNKINLQYLPIRTGSATLVAGTKVVSLPFASATDIFMLTRTSDPTAATAGELAATAIDSTGPAYGFTITSGNAGDVGVVSWVQISAVVNNL